MSPSGCRGRRRGRAVSGFTLLETLVAISILSVAIVVILQLFSGGLKASVASGDYTTGVFYAREKMEEILLHEPITEGTWEGRSGDAYRWRAEIRRVGLFPEEEGEFIPYDAFSVHLEIYWEVGGKEKHIGLDTLRIGEVMEEVT